MLREALMRYGRHESAVCAHTIQENCPCGLDFALLNPEDAGDKEGGE